MNSKQSTEIHPTAIVSPKATIGKGVKIDAYVLIGDDVVVGDETLIGPHSRFDGPTIIGKRNRFTGHCSVGTPPQDLKYKGERTSLEIGDDNLVREFVTLNRGTESGLGKTLIGNHNLLMTAVHIAHDCIVGSNVIMANAATLAGHVLIEDHSNVGAFTSVHQFCRVGQYAFIGGYSVVTRDALPYIKTVGARGDANIYGINTIGLDRKGFSREQITALKSAYRILFHSKGLSLKEKIEKVRQSGPISTEVEILVDFMENSERGFTR
jgi:UDP-N-acetylglucosamine acyltransferase